MDCCKKHCEAIQLFQKFPKKITVLLSFIDFASQCHNKMQMDYIEILAYLALTFKIRK